MPMKIVFTAATVLVMLAARGLRPAMVKTILSPHPDAIPKKALTPSSGYGCGWTTAPALRMAAATTSKYGRPTT